MRPRSRCCTFVACLFLSAAPTFAAEVAHVPAARDATLIEDPEGQTANGAGPALFAGRNAAPENFRRRALLWFDVAAALPRQARVQRAFLTLHLTPSHDAAAEVAVHRVLDAWSEGPAFSAGGGGAPAQPGDATWLHRRYDDQLWVMAGGQFVAEPSTALTVEGEEFYTWQSTPQLVADVRLWLKAPERNFGWILLGDEQTVQSVKRFDSRESATPQYRPVLTVEFQLPPGSRRGATSP